MWDTLLLLSFCCYMIQVFLYFFPFFITFRIKRETEREERMQSIRHAWQTLLGSFSLVPVAATAINTSDPKHFPSIQPSSNHHLLDDKDDHQHHHPTLPDNVSHSGMPFYCEFLLAVTTEINDIQRTCLKKYFKIVSIVSGNHCNFFY